MMRAMRGLIDKVVLESDLAKLELMKIQILLKSQKEQLDKISNAAARYLIAQERKKSKGLKGRNINVLPEDQRRDSQRQMVRFFK